MEKPNTDGKSLIRLELVQQRAKNKSDFAKRIGISPSAIVNSINAKREVPLMHALAIEAEFGIRRDWLLRGTGEMEKGAADLPLEEQISLSIKNLPLHDLRMLQMNSLHRTKFLKVIERKRRVLGALEGVDLGEKWIRDETFSESLANRKHLSKFQQTPAGKQFFSDDDQLEHLMDQGRSILGIGLENRASFDTAESSKLNYELMLARMEAIHSEMDPESIIKLYPDSACSRIGQQYLAEVKIDAEKYLSLLQSAEKLFQDGLFQRAFAQSQLEKAFDSVTAKSIIKKTPTEKIQQLWQGDIQIEELLKSSTSP